MAKKDTESGVYRVTEIIGTSTVSWEDAAKKISEKKFWEISAAFWPLSL